MRLLRFSWWYHLAAKGKKNFKYIQFPRSILTLIGHVVKSLDKALYDDYLCLVASQAALCSGKKW